MLVSRLAEPNAAGKKPKASIQLSALARYVTETLEEMQAQLFAKAQCFMAANTFRADNFTQLTQELEHKRGFYKVFWCNEYACEAKLKEIQASARVIIGSGTGHECFVCAKVAVHELVVAKAY
jgi:prolyl-tRNA synthetase